MPNRRKPPEVHLLAGTFRKDRHARGNGLQLEAIDPNPPKRLTAGERAAWNELIEAARPYLAQSDRVHVEITARLLAHVRTGKAKRGHETQLERMLGKMGIGPQARSSLQPLQPVKPAGNRFEDL